MEPNSQIGSCPGQLTFAYPFAIQQLPNTVVPKSIKQESNVHHENGAIYFSGKIRDKRERILGLQKEIEDSEDEIMNQEREEEDFDPEKSEEDIFDVVVPSLGSDLYGLRMENEIEIKLLEEEIVELEKKKGGQKKYDR